jgi:cell division protein FtsN
MAKRKQARRQGSKSTPAWAWLLIGLLIGVLGFFAYRIYTSKTAETKDVPIPQTAKSPSNEDSKPASSPTASAEDDGVLDTDYSFYDVLPGEETMDMPAEAEALPGAVSDVPSTGAPTTSNTALDSAPNAEPTSDKSRYLLQAGAFESSADAEDLKARIALSGEPARVETAEVNGKTMYRVRLGPYEGNTAANAAKSNLAGQGIKTNTIKIQQ